MQPARLLCPWGFSRQECWSGLPCSPPGDLPNSGIEPRFPAFQVVSLPSEPPGKPKNTLEGSLSLLQGIIPTRGSNWGLLLYRYSLYELSYQGSSYMYKHTIIILYIIKIKIILVFQKALISCSQYYTHFDQIGLCQTCYIKIPRNLLNYSIIFLTIKIVIQNNCTLDILGILCVSAEFLTPTLPFIKIITQRQL